MHSLFKKLVQTTLSFLNKKITVDYDAPLYIPRGASGVRSHKPLGSGKVKLEFSRIKLVKIPFGASAKDLKSSLPEGTRFCDAKVLDALTTDNIKNNCLVHSEKIYKLIDQLGKGTGPVYFLNTTFEDASGREYVAILNRNRSSALRYIISIAEPITCLKLHDSLSQIFTDKAPLENFAAVYTD